MNSLSHLDRRRVRRLFKKLFRRPSSSGFVPDIQNPKYCCRNNRRTRRPVAFPCRPRPFGASSEDSGDGLRVGHHGCAAGTAGAAREPSRVREVARLRDDLRAGMATPCRGERRHSGPLSSMSLAEVNSVFQDVKILGRLGLLPGETLKNPKPDKD